jgi:release factor glutamine methyltransferase
VTVRQALHETGAALNAAGCPTPHVDAELLLAKVLEARRTDLFADPERLLTLGERACLDALVRRRAAREPAAYILGEWGFRSLALTVNPHVLVPRPETEIVVERALCLLEGIQTPLVLDVGTGSGAIALAIATERPTARVVATDIAADALAVAAENRTRLRLEGRVELVLGHLVGGLRGPFDLVVSNPPYVPPEEFGALDAEVRLHEPYEALVGTGQTAAIARRARAVLRDQGWLVLESFDARAGHVAADLRSLGYEQVSIAKDLAGRDRVVEGRWPGATTPSHDA